MNTRQKLEIEIVVDARQEGIAQDRWVHQPLKVQSRWYPGTDQEKFEVLSAIRQTYSPDEHANIRGTTRQKPDQVARGQGFTQLRYQRRGSSDFPGTMVGPVTIVRQFAQRKASGWIGASK